MAVGAFATSNEMMNEKVNVIQQDLLLELWRVDKGRAEGRSKTFLSFSFLVFQC